MAWRRAETKEPPTPDYRKEFRKAITDGLKECQEFDRNCLRAVGKKLLAEFDRRPDTGTFHGFYELLDHFERRLEVEQRDSEDEEEFTLMAESVRDAVRELQLSRGLKELPELKLQASKGDIALETGLSHIGGKAEMQGEVPIPVCPECDLNMSLLLQLDSIGRFPQPSGTGPLREYAFDGVGMLYVFKCPECFEVKAKVVCHD